MTLGFWGGEDTKPRISQPFDGLTVLGASDIVDFSVLLHDFHTLKD
jgi:hypothetical protein